MVSMSPADPPETRSRSRLLVAVSSGLVLAAVTLGSWLMIDGTLSVELGGGVPHTEDCPEDVLAPVVPERVRISVYNATNESGLAGEAADDLRDRGFRVTDVGNEYVADTEFDSIIRAGGRGLRQARTLQQHLPAAVVDLDGRSSFGVDLVLGSEYDGPETEADVEPTPGRLSCGGAS